MSHPYQPAPDRVVLGDVLPEQPRAYHHLWRTPRRAWWKALLAMVCLLVAFVVLQAIAGLLGAVADVLTGVTGIDDVTNFTVTPTIFLAINLSLGALIPVSMLLAWAFTGQRPGWLSSVEGRFRWRWLARCAVVIVPVYVLYIVLGMAVEGPHPGALQPNAIPFLLIVLCTTPFQAAGEEYASRGLLTRGIASWIARPLVALVVATLLTALLFASGHPNLDLWKVLGLLVFASGASLLTWRTGGLEAACLAHTANNMLLLVPTALWGDFAGLLNADGPGTPATVLAEVVVFGVILIGVEFLARRTGLARTSTPAPHPAPASSLPRDV